MVCDYNFLRLGKRVVRVWTALFLLNGFSLTSFAYSVDKTDWMPLEEVKPGMRGVWHTVVEGTEIREYELEILGTAPNFVGPREPVILARVVDEINILSGPVAGMSGSPVFIDGRLVGAYAYGYPWAKEQAIVGITPMQSMEPLLHWDGRSRGQGGSISLPEGRTHEESQSASTTDLDYQSLQPLPSPLMFSGVSRRTWDTFRPHLDRLGVQPMLAPSGEYALAEDFEMKSGSAIAAVLMRGDFSAAATGTVTWTDGERVLGFGHPFLQLGGVELPFAGAHVYTVVRNIRQSFKLSQPGPIIGTLYNDRLSGIAGKVGEAPRMASLKIDIQHRDGPERSYQAEVFPHPQLAPVLSAISVLESLTQTIESNPEQTYRVNSRILTRELQPIDLNYSVTGFDASVLVAMDLMSQLSLLMNNVHSEVNLEGVESHIEIVDEWRMKRVSSMQMHSNRYRPGDTLEASVFLRSYRNVEEVIPVSIELPARLSSASRYRILLTDAAGADQFDRSSGVIHSLEGLAHRMRTRRDSGQMYFLLLENQPGLHHRDRELAALPPSIRRSLQGGSFTNEQSNYKWQILAEKQISLDGIFIGQVQLDLPLQDRIEPASLPMFLTE